MLNEGLRDDWAKSMEDALKLVCANCELNHLTTILQILNLQVVHGWTNESVDQLLALLSSLLPPDSTLPTKQSQCKKKISKLGLGYIVELMQWHAQNKSTNGKQQHVADSRTWTEFDNRWPDFSQDPCNIRLGNKSVTSKTIDAYIEPLYEELMELWKGIEEIQSLRDGHSIQFTLRASLLFTIHDLLAYGTLSSLFVHGYRGCPACNFKDFVRHSRSLRKCIYHGHHAYLKMDHPYCQQKTHFNGQEENREAPLLIIGDYIIEYGQKRMSFIENDGIVGSRNDPCNESDVKRLCILYKLSYFKDIAIRHTVDFMHTEKNIAYAITETLFGALDTISSCEDFREIKIRQNIWVKKYRKLGAHYIWTKEQCAQFLQLKSQTHFPTGYVSSSIRSQTDINGLRGLKTHDYHIIIENILPIMVNM
ncbi:uncharacterized protein LOC131856998 [Cryptomeria japonica]|uniref:uncharacterized protein LOC131856998 n=1 Tax=Cryptomeria japonica TaxID=3369 RepID=UPI0027DA611D|nr:uncharacterized protein LOC131856998 [Cryptomeria japonica]